MITDECPQGGVNQNNCWPGSYHLDLSHAAYNVLSCGSAGCAGNFPSNGGTNNLYLSTVSWRFVQCPLSGNAAVNFANSSANVAYEWANGSKSTYSPLMFLDMLFPIKSITINGTTQTRDTSNQNPNFWGGMSGYTGTLTAVLTSYESSVPPVTVTVNSNYSPIESSPPGTTSAQFQQCVTGPTNTPTKTNTPGSPTATFTLTFTATPTPTLGGCLYPYYDGETSSTNLSSASTWTSSGTSIAENGTAAHTGTNGMDISYSWAAGSYYAGIGYNWTKYSGASPRIVNLNNFSYMQLDLNVAAGAPVSLGVVLADWGGAGTGGVTASAPYTIVASSSGWNTYDIPLSAFATGGASWNVTQVGEIDIQVFAPATAGTATVYLDNFGFKGTCPTSTPTSTPTATHTNTPTGPTATPTATAQCFNFDDFENGATAPSDSGNWDNLGGSINEYSWSGGTTTGVTVTSPGASGTYALQAAGNPVTGGFGVEGSVTAANQGMTWLSGLTFYVKASVATTLRVNINSAPITDSNYYGDNFTATTSWTQVNIPYSSLTQGWSSPTTAISLSQALTAVTGLSWQTAVTGTGPVTFWIDNVCIMTNNPPPTATATRTSTSTPTLTPTFTPSKTPTNSPTYSPTNTVGNTATQTPTASPTRTATYTPSATPTNTPASSSTPTSTPTLTPSPTLTSTPASSFTFTSTATLTASRTATNTPTYTPSATITNTPASSFTFTSTPTKTPTGNPTASPTSTLGNTATQTPTSSATRTPTLTPSATVTATPVNSYTPTGTPTLTPTGTWTGTPTNSATRTPTATITATFTATASATATHTATMVPSATATGTPAATFTFTSTPTPTLSSTPTGTSTPSATRTFTFTATVSSTATRTATPSSTPTAVTVSATQGTNPPPNSNQLPGTSNVAVQQLALTNPSTSGVNMTAVTLSVSGTGNAADITGVTLLANGVPVATATFVGNTAVFSFSGTLPASSGVTYTMTANFGPNSSGTYTFSVAGASGNNGQPALFTGLPVSGATITVVPATPTPTQTFTFTPSKTPTPTLTRTPTWSPTPSPTASKTPTPTFTGTFTWTPTATMTWTVTPTPTTTFPTFDDFSVDRNLFRPSEGPMNIQVMYSIFPGNYSLTIFNSVGEHILTLDSKYLTQALIENYQWDGKNKYGQDCASGVYIFYLSEPFSRKIKRVLLIR